MLRSVLIFVISFAVLAVGFLFVWRAQSSIVIGGQSLTAPTTVIVSPTSKAGRGGVGPASRPWVKSWDKGRLSSEFTATECTPQKDGSFAVEKPISKFYMNDGQYVVVTGDDGIVYTDNGGPGTSNNLFSGSAQPPRNGKLHKVHIEVYPNASATQPTMWMETENIRFDNDTLRMFTDPFTAPDGTNVPADKVPVTVRGNDYEFDGTGLTLRWNGRDGHLQRLEVSHGDRLLITNASKMSLPGMPLPSEKPASARLMPSPDMLASVDPTASSLAAPPATVLPQSPTPYRAVFKNEVRVFEGDRKIAVADILTIDFLGGSQAARPAPVRIADVKTYGTDSVHSDVIRNQAALSTSQISIPATTQPAKPANQPIMIRWTGQLLVTPLESSPPMMPLLAKQSVIRLVGSPAVLTPEGAEVRAASVTYRSPDGAVQIQNSSAVPVIQLTQMKGQVAELQLHTGTLDYDPTTSLATLGGPSDLTVPIANQKKPMTVNWSQKGVLHTVVPAGQTQPSGVDQVDLLGDVDVKHPTFTLNSDELHIALGVIPKPLGKRGETSEEPRLLTAVGKVDCELIAPGKPRQGIRSDKMTIAMEQSAQDKPYPRKVLAEGGVYAFDPDQHLSANQLEVFLTPKMIDGETKALASTNPTDDVAGAVQMESLHASSMVQAILKDKSTADCDDLRITTLDDGKQLVELSGSHGAKLTNGKGSWLTGPVIHLSPSRNLLTVVGAGAMHTIESSSPGTTRPTKSSAPARPVDITWTDSMNVNGSANTADVLGHVVVDTVDSAGTTSTVTAKQAHIDFIDVPKSTTKISSPTADPTGLAMGNKEVKRLTLTGDMHGESILKDTDGKLLHQADLFGEQMIYTAADGRAVIPGAGKLMVENHRSDRKTPPNASESGGSQGKMKIVWTKSLVYDQEANQITIDGDTHTQLQQDPQSPKQTEKDQPMQLDAQRLVVTLKNAETGAPDTKLTNTSSPDTGRMRLSHLLAVGAVHFSAKAVDFDAHTVDYDPDAQVLTARGTAEEPGMTTDVSGKANGSFGELVYDLQKQEVVSVSDLHGTLRR